MRPKPKRLILVTGTPRSGTTAVGSALAAAPHARELYEPFNRHVGMVGVDEDFVIPGSPTCPLPRFAELVDQIASVDYRLKRGVFPHDTGIRRLVKHVTGSRTTVTTRAARHWPGTETLIWKDPFAVFAVGAVRDLGIPVVVTVRNPWAMAASFKRLGWGFDAADVAQRLEAAGRPIESRMPCETVPDSTSNGAWNWRLAHDSLLSEVDGGGIALIDLDAVVDDPLRVYRCLYERVGLEWTDHVESAIVRQYRSADGAAASPSQDRAHVRDRDIRAVNSYWTEVLDPQEIDMITDVCEPTWTRVQASFTTFEV